MNTSQIVKQALPNSDVDYPTINSNRYKRNKEFQGFVGLSKEIHRKICANYSEDLNMACINSDIKLMIVFLLFKFIVLLFSIRVQIGNFSRNKKYP
jgi:hypothetical protein